MSLKLYLLTILAAAVILAGCNAIDQAVNTSTSSSKNSSLGPETTYPDGARRVTPAELDTLMKKGQVFVVDVRNQAMFDAGHIPGAKLIPSAEITNHLSELPRDKMIVTYCS